MSQPYASIPGPRATARPRVGRIALALLFVVPLAALVSYTGAPRRVAADFFPGPALSARAFDQGAPLESVSETDCVYGHEHPCAGCPLQGSETPHPGYFFNATTGTCAAYLNEASSPPPFATLESCMAADCPVVYGTLFGADTGVTAAVGGTTSSLDEMQPIACKQTNCFGFDGPGDVFVGADGVSYPDSYGANKCRMMPGGAKVFVNIPTDTSVYRAFMYWSSTGDPGDVTTATLNSKTVTSAAVFKDTNWRLKNMAWYGAYADVTDIVRKRGNYVMNDFSFDPNVEAYCQPMNETMDYAYGAMSLVVVYEKPGMRPGRTNICFNSFRLTYPNDTYQHTLRCMAGDETTKFAKTNVVGFLGDGPLRERWYINNKWSGANLFRGVTDRMVDNMYWEITNIVKTGTNLINYAVRSRKRGLFFPVRVAYYTL